MAGQNLGAPPPAVSPFPTLVERSHTLRLVPKVSRTRRNHGCFVVGNELAAVYSSRRDGSGRSVVLEVGAGALRLSGGMTSVQARALARALVAAALAADRPHLEDPGLAVLAGQDLPCALPGLWREQGGLDDLVRLDVPPTTPGMVVVARASEDWFRCPNLRWQTWPDLLSLSDVGQVAAVPAVQPVVMEGGAA